MRGAKHVIFILLIATDLIQYKNGKQTFWQVNPFTLDKVNQICWQHLPNSLSTFAKELIIVINKDKIILYLI